jgi:hypothetical protein
MFDHPGFVSYSFEDVPLDRDLVVMDEKWMKEYEKEWIAQFAGVNQSDPYALGYITPVAARSVGAGWLEMSWYLISVDRFHEIPVFLPKSSFVACVDVSDYDEKPHIFVRTAWLAELHERPLATFAIVDAIGIKSLLQKGELLADALAALRDRVDAVADQNPQLGFISFADTFLVKQVWSVGHVESQIRYTYEPESLFPVIAELHRAIEQELGTGAYTLMTQGINAYDDPVALHVSGKQNHVSLNSLGVPFAQLRAIEDAARGAIRAHTHAPSELYMDSNLFRSLRLKIEFDRDSLPAWPYQSPMTNSDGATYIATSASLIVNNLAPSIERPS